jgi:(4-O-methyl)-D-glucuronate---lignin esterase
MTNYIASQISVIFLFAFLLLASSCHSQETWQANPEQVAKLTKSRPTTLYEESKVPEYTLPDPLMMSDGTKVKNAQTWQSKRRPEILELFRTHMYGRTPIGKPANMAFKLFDKDPKALDGLATRKQITISPTGKKGDPSFDLLIYQPNNAKNSAPAFLLLNFGGNHTIHTDPGIKLSQSWMRQGGGGVANNRATEKSRGRAAGRFPLELILKRGYALATIYYGDIDPDFHDGYKNGIHPLYDKLTDGKRAPDAWASIAAWAWGLSRALDYFETDSDLDHQHVAVLGHSRLGKTSLWAGAEDERFAMVISNDSGCGGAALNRRAYGESVARINKSFPHWFCDNFKQYNNNESALPLDQHMLIALAAPRPVYVASADTDLWADPRGEYLSCKHAEPVYKLFKKKGLGVKDMPPLDTPAQKGTIGYHVRTGGHNLAQYDWQQYLNFADKHFK